MSDSSPVRDTPDDKKPRHLSPEVNDKVEDSRVDFSASTVCRKIDFDAQEGEDSSWSVWRIISWGTRILQERLHYVFSKFSHSCDINPLDVVRFEAIRKGEFVYLRKEWLLGSGLNRSSRPGVRVQAEDTIFFVREYSLLLFSWIESMLAQKEPIGIISGQPGTGKSMTAYLMALMLAVHRKMIVLWIHINKEYHTRYVYEWIRMDDGKMYTRVLASSKDVVDLIKGPWDVFGDRRKRLLFVDGIVDSDIPKNIHDADALRGIKDAVMFWIDKNPELNRVIYLSSLGTSDVLTPQKRVYYHPVRFVHMGWDLAEYLSAVAHGGFRATVYQQLIGRDGQMNSAEELVRRKFYYTGGCARFMFKYTTASLEDHITDLLEKQTDLSSLTDTGHGNASCSLSHSLVHVDVNRNRSLLCDYVKHYIARKLNCDNLLAMARQFQDNPVMRGWIFEVFFFQTLSSNGTIFLVGPMNGPEIVWNAGSELWVPFSPDDPTIASCPFKEWLRPIKYNQGGFDAVYMTEEGEVEFEGEHFKTVSVLFVQCTIAVDHTVKLEFCCTFLKNMLTNLRYKTIRCEFYFIVPSTNVNNFKIGTTTGRLSQFGWNDHSLQVRGIKGWIS